MGIDDETIRAAIETGHMVEKGAMRKFSEGILVQKSATTDNEPCEALKVFGVH